MTTPYWMNSQDGANGTREALKPLQVLDPEKLTAGERDQLRADGFVVGGFDAVLTQRELAGQVILSEMEKFFYAR